MILVSYLPVKQREASADVSDKPVQPFPSLFHITIGYLHHPCRLQKLIITRKALNALLKPADLLITRRDLFLQGRVLILQRFIAEHELPHPCRESLQNFFLGIHDDLSPNSHRLTKPVSLLQLLLSLFRLFIRWSGLFLGEHHHLINEVGNPFL